VITDLGTCSDEYPDPEGTRHVLVAPTPRVVQQGRADSRRGPGGSARLLRLSGLEAPRALHHSDGARDVYRPAGGVEGSTISTSK